MYKKCKKVLKNVLKNVQNCRKTCKNVKKRTKCTVNILLSWWNKWQKVPRFREGLKKNNNGRQLVQLAGNKSSWREQVFPPVESSGIGHCQNIPFKELYITKFRLSNITTEVFDDKLSEGLFLAKLGSFPALDVFLYCYPTRMLSKNTEFCS